MDRDRPPMTPKQQQQVVIFGWIAAVLVGLLSAAAISHGSLRTVAAIIGLPLLVALFVIARRSGMTRR
ncbi:MAG TPA: hypothetical protein VFZ97_06700 [Acidimicrobiales bacterium]